MPRRQFLHDFLGTAADHVDLDLAVDPFGVRAAHVPHPAEQLHRRVRAVSHGPRRDVLQHAHRGNHGRVARRGSVDPRRHVLEHRARGLDRGAHVDQAVPDHLVVGKTRAERATLARPAERFLVADPGEPDGAGRQREPLAVEVLHHGPEALAFLSHPHPDRHPAAGEPQVRGVGRPPAHLLQFGAFDAGGVTRHDQQRQAARAGGGRVGADRHDDPVRAQPRRDECLLAFQHVVIAVADCPRAQGGDVRPTAGFGDRERRDSIAGQYAREHPRLEFRTAEQRQRRHRDRVRHQRGDHAARTALSQFDACHQPVERVGAGDSTVLFREAEAQQADSGCPRVQRPRERLRLVPFAHVRRDLAFDEAAHRKLKVAVVVAVPSGTEFERFHAAMLGATSRRLQARRHATAACYSRGCCGYGTRGFR